MGRIGYFDAANLAVDCEKVVGRKEERKKGEWKVEEEEWMDGSITGFTELTASSSQPASQHSTSNTAAAWTWVL
jgi:hypothetical protein